MASAAIDAAARAYRQADFTAVVTACDVALRSGHSDPALLLRGLALAHLGRVEPAVRDLGELVRSPQASTSFRVRAAAAAAKLGHVDGAVDWLDAAVERRPEPRLFEVRHRIASSARLLEQRLDDWAKAAPDDTGIAARAASQLLGAELWYEARDPIACLVARAPASAQTWLLVSEAERQSGQYERAAAAARQAIPLAGDTHTRLQVSRALLQAGGLDEALSAVTDTGDPAELSWCASLHVWLGHPDEAERLASLALLLDARSVEAQRVLGAVALLRRLPHLAIEPLAMAARAGDAEASALLGETHLSGGNLALGGLHLKAAVARSEHYLPGAAIALVLATPGGIIAQEAQEIEPLLRVILRRSVDPRSTEDLREALGALGVNRSAWPTVRRDGACERLQVEPSVRHRCATLRNVLRVRGFEETIRRYQPLLDMIGPHPLIHTYRGELLMWEGRYEEAREDCLAALTLNRRTRWAWVGLAGCQMLLGDPRTCLATLAEASELVTPALSNPLVYKGEAELRLGRGDAACATLEQAAQADPSRVSAWLLLAAARATRGDTTGAASALLHVRSIAPGLLLDAHRGTGLPADAPTSREAVDYALHMLRGNRSSSQVTYFPDGSRPRLVQVQRV